MGNCCKKNPPTVISVSGQDDIKHKQDDITLLSMEKDFTKFEKNSLESIYKYIPAIPLDNKPVRSRST